MKPTCAAILGVFHKAQGEWVKKLALVAAGGTRFGARLDELHKLGYVFECRTGYMGLSEYRLTSGPPSPYTSFSCPSCGWKGEEPAAIRGMDGITMLCPHPIDGRPCSTATQVTLL